MEAPISASLILLHITGAVCLLLWGTRMVKLGFTRAYGTSLRKAIANGTKNRINGFFCGMVTTTLLQSSTATALLLISFAQKHVIPTAAALGVLLGADIATTLVAQILSFDFSWLSPAFLALGVILYKTFDHSGRKMHLARVLIGLGLMLLSLALIRDVSAPLKESETLPLILAPLTYDPVFAILFAAAFTWLLHSSLASVLLFASLALNGIIPPELGLLLVLGANLGGTMVPFALTYSGGPVARHITTSNLAMKITGVILALVFMPLIVEYLKILDDDPSRMLVNFHTGFNVVLALIFLPIACVTSKAIGKIFPMDSKKTKKVTQYLDDDMLETPVVALAAAARETLRMAEMVEDMFKKSLKAFEPGNENLIKSIRKADNKIDDIFNALKLYMTRLSQEGLDPKEADRYIQILTFSTNLEHVGDILDKSLMDLAEKKSERSENFSEEGFEEIRDFHAQVLENMKLAQAIFMSEDPKLAAQLVEEKGAIRAAADETSAQHFKRLQSGKRESIATSAMHLDIVRDYRRINSYITRVAFAIIENAEAHKHERHSK